MTFERDITEAFDRLHTRSAERTWIYGLLGYQVDGNYMIELPNQPGAVYVLLGYDGDRGLAIAQNRIGADTTQGGQRIKMKRENGQLLIREAEFLAAGGGGSSGIDHLSDLIDVNVTSPSAGDKLVWSAALGKWVNGAASAVTTHALGGSLSPHTGQLDDSQALQFLKTDGSRGLTGDLTVSAFVTIDGVDLDVHRDNPDAHHHRATVGNGLSIDSAQGIAFDFDTNPGLEFNASNANRLRVKIDTTLVRASTGVGVNLAHDFSWSGDHTFTSDVVTFNTDPQVNANINLIKSTTAYLTSRHNLYLQPGYDNNETTVVDSSAILYLNPAGVIQMANTKEFRSNTTTDAPTGIDGIDIFNRSDVSSNYVQMNIGAIKADELFVRVFTADVERINLGSESWAKSVGKTSAGPDGSNGFALPAVGGTVDVWFENLPELENGDLFKGETSTGAGNGDWLQSRSIDMGVGLVNQDIHWQVISKITTGTLTDGTGVQKWRIKRRSGGTSTVGYFMKKGITFLDQGVVGQGIVNLTALNDQGGPHIKVGKFDHVDTNAPAFEYKTQFGNLIRVAGFTEEVYGIAAGNNLGLNPAAGAFTGFTLAFDATDATKNGLRLYNSDINIFDGSDLVVSFNKDRGIRLQHDTAQFDNEYTILQWFDDVNVDSTRRAQISSYQNGSLIDPLLYIGSFPDTDGFSTVILAATSPGDLSNGLPSTLTLVSGLTGSATLSSGVLVDLFAPHVLIGNGITSVTRGSVAATSAAVLNVLESTTAIDDTTGVLISNTGTGDAALRWRVVGGQTFTAGIDNSTFADVWKLSAGNSLGTTDFIIINPDTGVVTINGLDLAGGTGITGLVAGSGINIAGTMIAVDSSVVRNTLNLVAGSGISGGGDLSATRTFDIDLASPSGLSLAGGLLALSDSVAGSGLGIAGKILFVDPSIAGGGLAMTPGVGVMDVVAYPTGGLQVNPGTIQVKLPTTSGLNTDVNGLYVKLPTPSGLTRDTTGLYIPDAIAGNGLVFPSKILAVGQGVGMVVGLNDVALGPPSDVSVVSANSVTGTTHTHNIVSSSDVTTPTPFASILESTSFGGLTLGNLTVNGAVRVLNNGDLMVGNNNLFVDVSLHSVGIERVPDGQFALDVNGAIRGDLIVGKHAIQLKGVLLLSHFDGGDPYATNMTGESSGHMGQVGTLVGGAIFRPGHFYKALQCAPAKTNLCQNPSFEEDLTNWSIANGGSWTRTITDAFVGSACVKGVTSSNSQSLVNTSLTGLTVGAVYTVSAWIRRETLTGTSRIFVSTSTFANQTYTQTVTADQGWTRVSVRYTVDASRTLRVGFQNVTNGTAYFDAVQIEASYLSPYLDGSLSDDPGLVGSGHSWAIDDKNGSSSRTDGKLTYPTTGNIHADRGTIMAWIYSEDNTGSSGQGIVDVSSSWPKLALYLNASGTAQGIWGTGASFANGPSTAGSLFGTGWHHVAFTWSIYTHEAVCYVDGVPGTVNTAFTTTAPTLSSVITVGQLGSLGGDYFNGLIDDLVILDHVMTPKEILAVFESDAPVFAESSVFTFRATPKGLVWADEEGLWMHNTSGYSVLGVYGGDAPTKSWGGAILQQGDLLVGDASRGATLLWDDSLGTLQLGKATAGATNLFLSGTDLSFRVNATERISLSGSGIMEINDSTGAAVFTFNASAGAEFTKPLTLGLLGGIYQGSGTFSIPITGLKLFNVSGTGKLAGYNGGVEQIKLDTDGRLYAGAGNVKLDVNGLTLQTLNTGSLDWTPGSHGVGWILSGVDVGGISAQRFASNNYLMMGVSAPSAGTLGIIYLQANPFGSTTGGGELTLDSSGAAGMAAFGGKFVEFSPTHIMQNVTTGAQPALQITQFNDLGAFIDFDGDSGSGSLTPISTAVPSSYYGKVRVSVNGVPKWLALYN
jgi:hypothetical protein